MLNLDDPKLYGEVDRSDMLGRIRELPEACRQAWRQASAFDLVGDYSGLKEVVFLGMGGSAIGGDFLASLLAAEGGVPLMVCRDYNLPAFVGPSTLVVASSYSGETEETLSAFSQALTIPARKLAISTGGKLKTMAQQAGVPLFPLSYKAQPRAAFGYSFISLVALFQKMGLLADKAKDFEETLATVEGLVAELDVHSPLTKNQAKKVATKLQGRLAVIYGAGILAEVARRWKTQLNENSKAWAFHEVFPELNHNAVVGYNFPSDIAGRIFVVLLSSPSLHPRIRLRYRLTAELLARAGVESETIEARGSSPLCQMMSIVTLGDFVSYYLAVLYKADPSPVAVIDWLKQRLSEG